MLISLTEYAKLNGRDSSVVRRKAIKGDFKTAQKIGRNWVIDSEEDYPKDARIKTGKYKNWRNSKKRMMSGVG